LSVVPSQEKSAESLDQSSAVIASPRDEKPGLHARDTRRVFEELIGSAERSILVSTCAFFDGPRALELLSGRMEARPELEMTLRLTMQRRRGDAAPSEELVGRFAEKFWKADWPGAARPSVYYDPRALEPDGPAGVLHAKALVVHDEAVFVTSANLTEAALDRNIEVGVLLRDRALALSLARHFRILMDRGLLRPLPGACTPGRCPTSVLPEHPQSGALVERTVRGQNREIVEDGRCRDHPVGGVS
jgi:phosphatidylserine/phosphatidylglycerophosphate/cardiolipin synthase-like enzyme